MVTLWIIHAKKQPLCQKLWPTGRENTQTHMPLFTAIRGYALKPEVDV